MPERSGQTGYTHGTMCLAAPARVLSISGATATVDYGGVETTCRLETLSEDVAVGDYVLIHTGFAIRRLSPEDGEETLRLFDELAASLAREDSASTDTPEPPAERPSGADGPPDEPAEESPNPPRSVPLDPGGT